MGRDGPYDRSAFAHGLPHEPRPQPARVFPPSPPLPAHPPPALSPAPNPPGGRPARRAERRRRSRGPALLRRSERRSCRRGSACPASPAPPACRRARSFRGRHALGRAGTAPSCHRPAGPLGLSCCARPAPCSCATPMRQSWCFTKFTDSGPAAPPGRLVGRGLVPSFTHFYAQCGTSAGGNLVKPRNAASS